jgi:hypothetical protein
MTREEIEAEYVVRGGIIVSPGKFEGQPLHAPHFWALGLEGAADEDDGECYAFHVDSSDVERFAELAGVRTLRLVEDANGFVRVFEDRG